MSDQSLITKEQIAGIELDQATPKELLESHISTHYKSVHGNWTKVNVQTLNTLGHRTGRRSILVRSNGHNYYLPADPLSIGPIKFPVIVAAYVITNNTYHGTNLPTAAHSYGEPSFPPFTFGITVTGTGPFTYTWEYYNVAINEFEDIITAPSVKLYGGCYLIGAPTQSDGGSSSSLGIWINRPGEDGGTDPITWIRVKISNEEIGGGTTQSVTCKLSGYDEDDDGGLFCWVAREVYGAEDLRWKEFRSWMLTDAPKWFAKLYCNYGKQVAKWIHNKPRLKKVIRRWMDGRIS